MNRTRLLRRDRIEARVRMRRLLGGFASPAYFRLVQPFYQRGRHRARRELLRSEFWSVEQLRALQEQRLRTLLQRVTRSSGWYRERLRDAPPPNSFTLADLARLPILEKHELQQSFEEITGAGDRAPGVYREFSGGSTGTPVQVLQSRRYLDFTAAELERDYLMCNGFRMGQPRLFIWGSARDQDPRRAGRNAPIARAQTLSRDILLNQLWVGGLLLDADLQAQAGRLSSFRPRLVVGYVSSLLAMARVLREPLRGLAAVQASAETLTAEHRAVIEDSFGAAVYNRYGTREVGNLAHECSAHAGLHLLMENSIVEVVDGRGEPLTEPGAEGEVVVTSLLNEATPLVRYRLGDFAQLGERGGCACGRSSPRLEAVLGRTSGLIVGPSGKRLHGEFFSHLFYGHPVVQFRVEQLTIEQLRVEVIAGPGYTDATQAEIVNEIRERGDGGFAVDWRRVERIAPSPSGKFQFTISQLQASGRPSGLPASEGESSS